LSVYTVENNNEVQLEICIYLKCYTKLAIFCNNAQYVYNI